MTMKSVDQKMADDCIKSYADSISSSKVASHTTAVGFDSKKLLKWLKKVAPHSSEIQIKFGNYTAEYSDQKSPAGRTTVFLCPCDEDGEPSRDESGSPISPVNAGNPYP